MIVLRPPELSVSLQLPGLYQTTAAPYTKPSSSAWTERYSRGFARSISEQEIHVLDIDKVQRMAQSLSVMDETAETIPSDNHTISDLPSSEDESRSLVQPSQSSRTVSTSSHVDSCTNHVVALSSIEHCMPKAYIRICFAFRAIDLARCNTAIESLRSFIRQIVDAKPYLSGYTVQCSTADRPYGRCEVHFNTAGFVNDTQLEVRELRNTDGSLVNYDELDNAGLPPSRLRPEEVALLPTDVDDRPRAPLFHVQANVVDGGIIVSVYLHHCVSDGKGFELLVTGEVLHGELAFQRHLTDITTPTAGLDDRLKLFAQQKTAVGQKLSSPSLNAPGTRKIQVRNVHDRERPKNKPGRGCIVWLDRTKIHMLHAASLASGNDANLTRQNVLMAFLWQHMTRARRPSVLQHHNVTSSKLLIPVDIRSRINDQISESYFGAAVDFAKAELTLDVLVSEQLGTIAVEVRRAVDEVNDCYVRQAIAVANLAGVYTDVADLQAANMDRVTGADMYITSWLHLRMYQADFGMGLGPPDWVRKPWSRDPGSCIILPDKGVDPGYYEVVVQMTERDMNRLLDDKNFMASVVRIIE